MFLLRILLLSFLTSSFIVIGGEKPRFIFYFIGDGMGPVQVQSGEFAMQSLKARPLSFTSFPVKGEATTYSANEKITDSAAAGTALATGEKTNNGCIAQSPKGDKLESITTVAQQQGWQVGVMTTAPLNDATPAVFYSHVSSRNQVNNILRQLPNQKLKFLFGKMPKKELLKVFNHEKYLREKGLQVIDNDEKQFKALKPQTTTIYAQFDPPYYFDRTAQTHLPTLPEMVSKGIEIMDDNQNFFMMIEGGRIDHACHENHFQRMIFEVMEFSDAVQVAIDFMKKHPEDTLIVITADHETGGLGYKKGYDPKKIFPVLVNKNSNSSAVKEALSWTTWETTGHSSKNVPVYASGKGAEIFVGEQDNTDIAKKIKTIIKK